MQNVYKVALQHLLLSKILFPELGVLEMLGYYVSDYFSVIYSETGMGI